MALIDMMTDITGFNYEKVANPGKETEATEKTQAQAKEMTPAQETDSTERAQAQAKEVGEMAPAQETTAALTKSVSNKSDKLTSNPSGLLIDMLTNITSFNYEKVGQKHGEYFGEDKATGFTPNRAVGDATEYQSSVFPPLGTTNFISPENPLENLESIHIMNPDGTDYFQPDYNPLSDAESIHIMNPDGTNYFTPNYNPLEGESIFESSFVDYFDNTHQTGFSTPEFKVSNFVNQDGFSPTAVNYFDDTHQTGLHLYPEHKVSYFVNQDGFTPTFVDYFDNTHQTGFSTPILKESNFVNQDGFTPTAVNYFGDENHPGFNLEISHGEDAESHYIIGSGNDFNYPLAHTPRPVVDRFDNTHGIGFTAGRINAKLPSEFIGISEDGFTQTGTKYEMGDYNFAGQHDVGLSYFLDINATGFTSHRTQKDLGPGLGESGFHTIEDGGTAGEYIVGSSLYDDIGLTNFFDIDKVFTTGLFVKEMTTLESDFNASVDDTFQFNMSGLTNLDYTRINNAIDDQSDSDYGRRGQGTNLPKTSDFRGGINTPDGEDGQYHNELRISDYKDQWKKFGGNAKGLRGSGGFGFDEPFIIKEIGERYDTIGFGMVDGLTDIPFIAIRAIEDVKRLAKWTLTPKGIVWNLKQVLLQSLSPKKSSRIFNPLGTLASALPLLHTPRHTKGTFIDFKNPPSYPDDDDTFLQKDDSIPKFDGKDVEIYSQQVIQNTELKESGFLRSGILGSLGLTKAKKEQDASKYNLGSGKVKAFGDKLYMVGVSNRLQVHYGGKLDDKSWVSGQDDDKAPKDFIKFKIRDVVNGKWLIFPAHLGTITDTVTPSWTPEKYIGRPDSVHLYTGTDRSVSFDFKVAAFTKQEIPIIQEKMNYLMGLGYPTYKKILSTDDETRPVAPYIELTIGDLFNATPGYFSSISITMEENSTWELDDGFQIPQFFSVGVEFVHIGKYLPTTLGKHYEVPWLTDSGVGDKKFGTFGKQDPRGLGNVPARLTDNKWSKGSSVGK